MAIDFTLSTCNKIYPLISVLLIELLTHWPFYWLNFSAPLGVLDHPSGWRCFRFSPSAIHHKVSKTDTKYKKSKYRKFFKCNIYSPSSIDWHKNKEPFVNWFECRLFFAIVKLYECWMNVLNTTGHRCRQRRRESDNLGPRRRKTWRQLYIIRKIGACSENYNSFEESHAVTPDRHVMYIVINRPDGPPVIIVCYTGCTNKSFNITLLWMLTWW